MMKQSRLLKLIILLSVISPIASNANTDNIPTSCQTLKTTIRQKIINNGVNPENLELVIVKTDPKTASGIYRDETCTDSEESCTIHYKVVGSCAQNRFTLLYRKAAKQRIAVAETPINPIKEPPQPIEDKPVPASTPAPTEINTETEKAIDSETEKTAENSVHPSDIPAVNSELTGDLNKSNEEKISE